MKEYYLLVHINDMKVLIGAEGETSREAFTKVSKYLFNLGYPETTKLTLFKEGRPGQDELTHIENLADVVTPKEFKMASDSLEERLQNDPKYQRYIEALKALESLRKKDDRYSTNNTEKNPFQSEPEPEPEVDEPLPEYILTTEDKLFLHKYGIKS